jgi:hypothetical protein
MPAFTYRATTSATGGVHDSDEGSVDGGRGINTAAPTAAVCDVAGRWVDGRKCFAQGSTELGRHYASTNQTLTTDPRPLGVLFLGDSHARLLSQEVSTLVGLNLEPPPKPHRLHHVSFEVLSSPGVGVVGGGGVVNGTSPVAPELARPSVKHAIAHGDAIYRFGAHLDRFFGPAIVMPGASPTFETATQHTRAEQIDAQAPPPPLPALSIPGPEVNGGLSPENFTHVVLSRGFWDLGRNFNPPALLEQYMQNWDDVIARFPATTQFIHYELHSVFDHRGPRDVADPHNFCIAPWRVALVRAVGVCAAYRTVRRYREVLGRPDFTIQRFVVTKETSQQAPFTKDDGHHFRGAAIRSHAQKFLRLFVCADASDYADDEVAALGFHESAAMAEGQAACLYYEAQKHTPYDTTRCTCLSRALNPNCPGKDFDRALGQV